MHIEPSRVGRALASGALLVSASVLTAAPSFADDCVVPAADVVTGVVLRAQPTTSSVRLGLLKPGDAMHFVSPRAGWYEAAQANGTSVFASKRWTQVAACASTVTTTPAPTPAAPGVGPAPLTARDHPVDWWIAFKFNSAKFPGCGNGVQRPATCPFGGTAQTYKDGQQYAVASSASPQLARGPSCVGTTEQDPVGATYDEIYNGRLHYLVWNDQFKGHPGIAGCSTLFCAPPWGHSKGIVAWDDSGAGVVMQVTTPSWPGSGNQAHPRQSDGNTLGCVTDDDVEYSQHFFALRLSKDDLLKVLRALGNASVATDPGNLQLVDDGGPPDVQSLVSALGQQSAGTRASLDTLSSGVRLISKPSALHVPPWQLVSSLLGAVPLRVASWWSASRINSTSATTPVDCWDNTLVPPGAVEIATSGSFNGVTFGLKGSVPSGDGNHAKIGVSTDADSALSIFGDMNQEGALTGACDTHQNGRGGIFFVVQNHDLTASVTALIAGDSAPLQ
jgi:hypothetical protein